MKKYNLYLSVVIAVVAIAAAIYYYTSSRAPSSVRERFIDIFDEQPSVSCSNLVMTAWSANQLEVDDDLKIAINDIFHSQGITAPIPQDEFDDIVSQNDSQLKELFTRAKNEFYPNCEEKFLNVFAQCEHDTSNQSDFLKCWVDNSSSENQQSLYGQLTKGNDLPEIKDEPGVETPQVDSLFPSEDD